MNTRVKHSIIDLARAAPDVEVCGFIYCSLEGLAGFAPCTNVAANPAEEFEISADDYVRVSTELGHIIGVYHSHPKGRAAFSEADIEAADEFALPLYLYAVETGEWLDYIPSTYRVELEGRQFCAGHDDCYGTVRTYFRQELGVYLSDYDRDETSEDRNGTQILERFAVEGFVGVGSNQPIMKNDVLLFKAPGYTTPQHMGVVLAGNRMLHHQMTRLSTVDDLDDKWMRRLVKVIRYQGRASSS
jgi:proteasome lid subunit RPN8/RPN11